MAILISQRRQWHPTPVLLPGKSHGQRSLVGGSPWHSQVLRTHFKTILSWLLCGVTCRSSFFFSFCMWLSSFLTLYWRKCTFLTALLYRITSGLCILLNWSMSLLLCQYHTILVTLALKCVEKEKATHSSILPGESQGRGSLVGCRLWGCTESDTTEAT